MEDHVDTQAPEAPPLQPLASQAIPRRAWPNRVQHEKAQDDMRKLLGYKHFFIANNPRHLGGQILTGWRDDEHGEPLQGVPLGLGRRDAYLFMLGVLWLGKKLSKQGGGA